MINGCMAYYNIQDYRYDIKDHILFIYQSLPVKKFVKLKYSLYILRKYHKLKLTDIIVKAR